MSSNSLKHPAKNFLELVGNTPLIRLNAVSDATGCEIYGKAEFANPGGSVKDRAAKGIIEAAEASGALKENGIIVEGTAGNTGIGIAMVANFYGINTKIVIHGTNKKKIYSLNQFFISYRKTKLKRSEFIYSIKIPLNRQNVFKAYKISKRFDDDISSVCGSFSFLIKKNRITKAAIAYGGMSEIPKRALTIEKNLINSEFSENTFSRAVDLMNKDFSPLDDMRASKNYRLTVAKNLLLKAFYEIKNKKNIRIHS